MQKKISSALLAVVLCANLYGTAFAVNTYDEAKIDQLLKDTSTPNDSRGGMGWNEMVTNAAHIVESYYRGETEKDKAIAQQLDVLDNLWNSFRDEVKQKQPEFPASPIQKYASQALQTITLIAAEMDKYPEVTYRDLALLTYLHERAKEYQLTIFAGKEKSLAYYKIFNHLLHKFIATDTGGMHAIIDVWKSYQLISYKFVKADMAVLDDLLSVSLKKSSSYISRSSDYLSYLQMIPEDVASPQINQHVALVLQSMNPKPKEFYEVFDCLRVLTEMNVKSPANVNRAPINQKYQLYATQIKTFPKWINKYQAVTFIGYLPQLKKTDAALAKNLAQAIKTRFAKEKLDDYYKKMLDEILK